MRAKRRTHFSPAEAPYNEKAERLFIMDFSLLKSFTAVADEKSFSTAAKHLFISQQSLSKQIAKLEEELGTTLFVRSRPLSLTPDGKQFLQTAKEILQLKQQEYVTAAKALGASMRRAPATASAARISSMSALSTPSPARSCRMSCRNTSRSTRIPMSRSARSRRRCCTSRSYTTGSTSSSAR